MKVKEMREVLANPDLDEEMEVFLRVEYEDLDGETDLLLGLIKSHSVEGDHADGAPALFLDGTNIPEEDG